MVKSSGYDHNDFAKVMALLGSLYQLNRERPYWLPARWEYAAYLVSPLCLGRGYPHWHRSIRIWTTGSEDIVDIVNSENPDESAFIHVHPHYRHLEAAMVEWPSKTLRRETPGEGVSSGSGPCRWTRPGSSCWPGEDTCGQTASST
ncbi:MAG: hypothetical protein AB1445_08735 [Bacillota bacterium]